MKPGLLRKAGNAGKVTRIRLSPDVSERVRKFWDKHGRRGFAMLAQPLARNGRYTLKVKMFSEDEADKLNELLVSIWEANKQGKRK